MTAFNLAELRVVGQFVPLTFLLVGLTVLWTQTVWFKVSSQANVPTLPDLKSLVGSTQEHYNYAYSFSQQLVGFDPNHAVTIIKRNLSWLLFLTLVLEVYFDYGVANDTFNELYCDNMLSNAPFVMVSKIVVLVIAWMVLLYAEPYQPGIHASTLMLIGSIVFFMLILVSSNNLIVFYIALEGVGLLSFVLTAQSQTNVSVEAGLKYFFQSSLASIVLLLGVALLFASTQSFELMEIRYVLSQDSITSLTVFAVSLMTIALLFKVSAFPGHFWAPDVYKGPIMAVLTFFAVGVKGAAFLALFNIYYNLLLFTSVQFNWLLYVASAASMVLGALGAIRVLNTRGYLRAFIAYTSINQVGFVLLGLVCMNGEGLAASFCYLIIYLMASLVFVGVLSRIRVGAFGEQTISRLDQLRLLYVDDTRWSRRFDLFVLSYAIWSMAGLPPLAGFFGKVGLWMALLNRMYDFTQGRVLEEVQVTFPFVDTSSQINPWWLLASLLVLSLIVSIVSGVYYFKFYELMSPPTSEAQSKALSATEIKAYVMHDRVSFALTIALTAIMTIWVIVISWNQQIVPLVYAPQLFDVLFGYDFSSFSGYTL